MRFLGREKGELLQIFPQRIKRGKRRPLYEAIDSSDQEIRLLELLPGTFSETIKIHLYKAKLKDLPVYEALSYAWGRELHDEEPALVNGTPFIVTDNLDCALRYLRLPKTRRTLWIDALCINQEDTFERNQQVQLMCFVYSNASNVLVWLHPIDPGGADRLAFDYINRDTVPSDSCDDSVSSASSGGSLKNNDEALLILALISLCRCTWFTRLWIVQELTLATQDPIVCCGFKTALWSQFCSYLLKIRRAVSQRERLSIAFEAAKPQQEPPIYSVIQSGSVTGEKLLLLGLSERIEYLYEVRRSGRYGRFATRLYRTATFEATDPRDKVYGVLGISSFASKPLAPDYTKTAEQVYCEAMVLVLTEDFASSYNLLPLLPLPDRTRNHKSLPSWVCDFSICNRCVHLGDRNPHVPTNLCPGPTDIQALLSKTRSSAPILRFSPDSRTLYTMGRHIGNIAISIPVRGIASFNGERVLRLDNIRWLIVQEKLNSDVILEALLGYNGILEHDNDRSVFRELLMSGDDYATPDDLRHSSRRLNDTLYRAAHRRILFVTDTGCVGLTYHSDIGNGVRPGDHVAGLFGIDFPFILRGSPGTDSFSMVNVANVVGHQWGSDRDVMEYIIE
ncbi:hypothetical protein GRF29_19g1733159 [Pseudopithomyces chartarum]|uniref:Heterokaryon incompatibility domain-containing protein n=1 Tax=Pseudopithomyces chartarum TaxID=1892770 RepID=A0AAN6M615_9PLEO|nr:hypothetical protein GRF29_19g1733159 [Pseudopithomyces chartarum]